MITAYEPSGFGSKTLPLQLILKPTHALDPCTVRTAALHGAIIIYIGALVVATQQRAAHTARVVGDGAIRQGMRRRRQSLLLT